MRFGRVRLQIWQKLTIIALAFLVPLILAAVYLVSQQGNSLRTSHEEVQGVEYARPLTILTLDLLSYRSLSTQMGQSRQVPAHEVIAAQAAVDRDFAQLSRTDRSLQERMNATVEAEGKGQLTLANLINQWQGIKTTGPVNALSAGFTPQLINNVLLLYSYLGDASKINFDPQPDTFYTGSAMLKLEPPLVNQISQLGDSVITATQADSPSRSDSRIQATGLLLSQQLEQLTDALNRAFEGTLSNNQNDDLRPTLAPLLSQVSTSVNALIGSANQQVSSGRSDLSLGDAQALTRDALHASKQLWNAMFDQEEHMLQTRISQVETRHTVLLVAIGTGLALIVALTTLMARSIARNVSSVAEAARSLTAGDLGRRARVSSHDEIATLADTFNSMADHLQESYTAVEEKVRVRTDELHQRTRSLNLLQGVAIAANKAITWDEALANGLPLICELMSWPAAHAYTTNSFDDSPAGAATDILAASPSWYTRTQWSAPQLKQVRTLAELEPSPLALRACSSGQPQGPEPLTPGTGWAAALPEKEGITGAVAFPVLVHQGNAGVVEFFTTKSDELNPSTTALITNLVSQLGRVREREIAAQKLESAARAAESANRAKGAFLATMSHEIRTPMNAVLGMTELLLDTSLSHEQRSLAEIVATSADSLLTIINDILDFSKFEAGKFELEQTPVDLRQCIESAFDLIVPRTREKSNLDLAYIIDVALPDEIMGDGLRLRQIIINLLSNAVKFTDTGEIVLTVDRLEPAAPPNGQPNGREAFTAHFCVRDTGMGIPPERMKQLFQPFEQLDSSTTRRYGGTGLGLAISQRLVKLMGGTIWAESEAGHGSKFHFTTPTQQVPSQVRHSHATPRDDLRGRRMLAVDDNPTNRMILTRQGELWGMHVRATGSPEEALGWIRDGDPFNVAVLDMQMPRMTGVALAREINALRNNLPMILLTSLGKADVRPEDLSLFSAYHTKPIKAAQLYASLRQALIPEGGTAAERPAIRTAPSPEPAPLRILLVEDNNVNQQLALRMLSKIGYSADAVGDGAQALEALRRQHYDVVLMDVQMPVMNGLDASRAIHQEWPTDQRPRIIALTASAMQEDYEACTAAGMDDFLTKPLTIKTLATTLGRYAHTTE
ncbi:response regulator [Streptomyces sp. NBC_01614]|uniref:response regulator n=1 Tax=Streptomyces sp. NBC_01614 TaxID=2975897 RepID=UPI00386DB4D6